jgi:hypothetical protein
VSVPSDTWYVRLPDGRVLRAASTSVVRQHLDAGRIPSDSRVRRSPHEEWIALDWTDEFADLLRQHREARSERAGSSAPQPAPAKPVLRSHVAARYDPARIQTVGLRALAEELIAALDNTLARSKLITAGLFSVFSALVWAVFGNINPPEKLPWSVLPGALALLFVFLGAIAANVILTQMTYLELSRLRPAAWTEARVGLVGFARRLFVAFLLAGGSVVAAIVFLHRWNLHDFAGAAGGYFHLPPTFVAEILSIVSLLLEVVLWAVLPFTFLLGPVVVVEESSVLGSLAQWWWLVRSHLGRLFLYESTAVMGGIAMLVFAFPLELVVWLHRGEWGNVQTATGIGLCLLTGLAAAPLIAYLAVAQVFIYLNVRYEPASPAR